MSGAPYATTAVGSVELSHGIVNVLHDTVQIPDTRLHYIAVTLRGGNCSARCRFTPAQVADLIQILDRARNEVSAAIDESPRRGRRGGENAQPPVEPLRAHRGPSASSASGVK